MGSPSIVVVAYFGASWLVPMDRWPDVVLQARTLPLAFQGATWLAAQVPQAYRPMLHEPPKGKEARSGDLLHAAPVGRATGPLPASSSNPPGMAKPAARE